MELTRATAETGEFAGWAYWPDDPFEARAGPFYMREARADEEGEGEGPVAAFRVAPHHCNAGGVVHGGCLMAFADFALFAIAGPVLEGAYGVTVSFASEFVAPARAGARIEARGEVTGGGRSLLFVRGVARAEGAAVLSFSGTIKRIVPRGV